MTTFFTKKRDITYSNSTINHYKTTDQIFITNLCLATLHTMPHNPNH